MFKFLSDSSCVDSVILTQRTINIADMLYDFGISSRVIENLLFVFGYRL